MTKAITKVMMTMMTMSDGWSVKGNQRGGHSIAALGKSHNPNATEKIRHEHFILDWTACRKNSAFWEMFPSKSKHIKRARKTLILSQDLLPKAFQPVYIAAPVAAA